MKWHKKLASVMQHNHKKCTCLFTDCSFLIWPLYRAGLIISCCVILYSLYIRSLCSKLTEVEWLEGKIQLEMVFQDCSSIDNSVALGIQIDLASIFNGDFGLATLLW